MPSRRDPSLAEAAVAAANTATAFGDRPAARWWQSRSIAILFALLAIVPLLYPAIPPLTDLPGHIGRFRILAEAGREPLAQHYAVRWALIGNLGVDGLVLALAPLIGLEPAARVVVLLIPAVVVAAMLWLAREVHGRIPPTALMALPLAYAAPFQLGFVNFSLASGLAIAGVALWLRLARLAPVWVRVALFGPLACAIWLCHAFGWAMLGLFVFGAEWAQQRSSGKSRLRAAVAAAPMCVPMMMPVVFAALWAGGDRLAGATGLWFNAPLKLYWAMSVLRERWQVYDMACIAVILVLIAVAARSHRLSFSPALAVPATLGGLAFLALPAFYAGASCVDMRMLPMTLALAVLAIRAPLGEDRLAGRLAVLSTGFFAMRLLTSTLAFALLAREQAAALRAVDVFRKGAAVLVLVNEPAADNWDNPRLSHIAGLATARRRVFTNEQWALPGQQLVHPRHPRAAPYDRDPSQLIYPATVRGGGDFDHAIASFDRATFDYVWTIGFPKGRARATDLAPVWSDGGSAVYRVRLRRHASR